MYWACKMLVLLTLLCWCFTCRQLMTPTLKLHWPEVCPFWTVSPPSQEYSGILHTLYPCFQHTHCTHTHTHCTHTHTLYPCFQHTHSTHTHTHCTHTHTHCTHTHTLYPCFQHTHCTHTHTLYPCFQHTHTFYTTMFLTYWPYHWILNLYTLI